MASRFRPAPYGYARQGPAYGQNTVHAPQRRGFLPRLQLESAYLLIVLVIFGYPMTASLVSFAGVDSTVVTIPYRAGVFGFALVLLASALLRRSQSRLDAWLMAFLLLYLARITYDWLYAELPGAFETWRFYVIATMVPTLAVGMSADLHIDHSALVRRFLLVGAVFCALFFSARLLGLSDSTTVNTHGGQYEIREGLEALNAISLGHVFASIFLASLIGFFMLRGTRWKIFSTVTGAVAIFGLMLAASRGPMLAMILAVGWFAIMRFSRAVFLIPLVLLGVVFMSFDSLAMRRLMEIFDMDINTMAFTMWIRLQIQQSALADLWENPIFGKHFLDPVWGEGFYPHNIVIETGMAMGFIGLAVLFMLHLKLAVTVLRHTNAAFPVVSLMLVQYFTSAQTSGSIATAEHYFPLVALALSLAVAAHMRTRFNPARLRPVR